MRSSRCLAFLLAFASPAAAVADPEAVFLGDAVYTTAADCLKHRKIMSGGPRAPATVPTILTAKGYASWQSSCTFVNIDERYKGRIWTVSLSCRSDGAEEALRTEVWRRQPDGELTITINKTSTTYVACVAAPAAAVKKK